MSYRETAQEKLKVLQKKTGVCILAIESSCDETAAAVVKDQRAVLSNAVYSQIPLHQPYGGVVPEIASRAHIEKLDLVVSQALQDAGLGVDEIDAIAVTAGPGLVGALLTGVSYAKALAFGLQKPLLAVHHIKGHICANYLCHADLKPPFLCLVASGGHSHLLRVEENGVSLVGCTQDDAAGEAFDKAARVLGLPYPGGPQLDKAAQKGDASRFKLPHVKADKQYDFSFSGIKTAFINLVHSINQRGEELPVEDLAASFREAVVKQLCDKTFQAMKDFHWDTLVLAGGVAANSLLRQRLSEGCQALQAQFYMPGLEYCGDNAAMIASAAFDELKHFSLADMSLNANPSMPFLNRNEA